MREISAPIELEEISDLETQGLIRHMQDVLNGIKAISDENGNALSAPQVGHLKRLIVLRINGVFYPIINPEFEPTSPKKFDFEEECFSLYNQRASVPRFYDIALNYYDENGMQQVKQLNGENAGLVQHEVDHLNGVLFLDHLVDDSLQSIDTLLDGDPSRLAQVKAMMAYMVEET